MTKTPKPIPFIASTHKKKNERARLIETLENNLRKHRPGNAQVEVPKHMPQLARGIFTKVFDTFWCASILGLCQLRNLEQVYTENNLLGEGLQIDGSERASAIERLFVFAGGSTD